MDELELLKRDWQKQNQSFQQVDENEIAKMQHKSSSSSVKWIFYISVIEFVVFTLIGFIFSDNDSKDVYKRLNLQTFMVIFTVINYIILIFFIVKFYLNYKKINNFSSVKDLMENILNARKTLKNYVTFNLTAGGFLGVLVSVFLVFRDPQLEKTINLNGENFRYLLLAILLLFFAVFIFILWLFYKLLYGFLIKRLKKNYKELETIEK